MTTAASSTPQEITTLDELEGLIGTPGPAAAGKVRTTIDALDVDWIARTPLVMLATSAADGTCDVSPKGDPPGFVHVLDQHTLVVPERPGNRRVDGYRNVVANPHAGLIFLIPGRDDTLRVNGRARLVSDAPYFDDMVVKGHRPVLAMELTVEQVFYHCAKAFLRSSAWRPETWDVDGLPSRATIVRTLERPHDSQAVVDAHYGPGYVDTIYRA